MVRSRIKKNWKTPAFGALLVLALGLAIGISVYEMRSGERVAVKKGERTSTVSQDIPAGTGELLVSWSRATQYTDDTALFLKTHEVCYGVSSGSWPVCVDLSTTAYPGMLEYRISDLEIGTEYFVVVRTVDSENNKSAYSAEVSRIVEEYVPETITWVNFSGGSITAPGDYKLTQNINSQSGNAINIQTGGVRLNCDGKSVTFATANSGNGINISTGSGDIEIYNCNLTQGGNNLGYGIGRVGASLGDNIKIHNNTINMNYFSYGGVTLDDYTGTISGHEIHNNTIYVNGLYQEFSAIGLRERSHTWSGKIHSNSIQMENCQYNSGYPSAIWAGRGSEVYKNDITMTSDNYQVQGYQGWNVDYVYYHDNVINSAAELTRHHLLDGASNDVYILWNTVNSTNGAGRDVSSPIRIRYGSFNVFAGFNTFTTTTSSDIACRTGSYDSIKGDAYDIYLYHNNCIGPIAGTIISAAHDFYYWSNTFNGRFDIEGTANPSDVSRYLSNLNFNFDTFVGPNITGNPRRAGYDLVDNNLTFCQVPGVASTDDITWIGSNPNERGGVVFPQSNCEHPVSKTPKPPTNVQLSTPAPA